MTFLLESNVKWLSWFVLSTSTTKCSGMVKYHSNQKPRDINHADDPKSYSLKLWFWIMRVRIQCRTLVFTFSQSAYHPICWPVIFKWSKSNFSNKRFDLRLSSDFLLRSQGWTYLYTLHSKRKKNTPKKSPVLISMMNILCVHLVTFTFLFLSCNQ